MRDYRRIHLVNKQIMTLQTFTELEKMIPDNIICRVHKSYMVSIQQIESIEKSRIKIKDKLIPISETYKAKLSSVIRNKLDMYLEKRHDDLEMKVLKPLFEEQEKRSRREIKSFFLK